MAKRDMLDAARYARLARDIQLLPEEFRAMLARRGMSYREAAREMGVVTATAWKIGNTQNRLQAATILAGLEWLELSSSVVEAELKESAKSAKK